MSKLQFTISVTHSDTLGNVIHIKSLDVLSFQQAIRICEIFRDFIDVAITEPCASSIPFFPEVDFGDKKVKH